MKTWHWKISVPFVIFDSRYGDFVRLAVLHSRGGGHQEFTCNTVSTLKTKTLALKVKTMYILILKWSLPVENVTQCPSKTPISNDKGMLVKDFVKNKKKDNAQIFILASPAPWKHILWFLYILEIKVPHLFLKFVLCFLQLLHDLWHNKNPYFTFSLTWKWITWQFTCPTNCSLMVNLWIPPLAAHLMPLTQTMAQ